MTHTDGRMATDAPPRQVIDLSQEVVSSLCHLITLALRGEGLLVDIRVNPYLDKDGQVRVITNLDAVGWQALMRLAAEAARRRLDDRQSV